MAIPHKSHPQNFRLLLIESQSMRVVTIRGLHRVLLPHEAVPVGRRVAQALNESIRQRFGFDTIQLAILVNSTTASSCAVHEIVSPQYDSTEAIWFEKLENIPASELAEEERGTINRIISGGEQSLGRFARLGWIEDFRTRVPLKIRRAPGAIRQLNQGVDFCLLTLQDSTGASFWFKAVGEPNLREYALTHTLADQFPGFLPRIVTSIPDWSGWIAEHVDGSRLDQSLSVTGWERALKSLVALQQESVSNLPALSAAGATDFSCAHLKAAFDPFFAEMRHAMRAQTSTAAPAISDDDLDRLRAGVNVAIAILEESGLPDSLLHRDIGHGNVIVSRSRTVFLDWAQAGIGHPFLSAEHLLADHECLHPVSQSERQLLRKLYSGLWRPRPGTETVERAAGVAPSVAALAYGIDTWESKPLNDRQAIWPLLRSILRRTKRDLEATSGGRA